MHLQRLPLTDLHPAPYNPRVPLQPGDPGWEKLRRSLQEFDLVQPIVWNRVTGHVVGGHQRLEVLRHEGRTHIDCVVVELPLAREQALNVALNNDAVGGDWDPSKLKELLIELREVPEFDATLTGFDDQQLRDLLFQPAELVPASVNDGDNYNGVTATLDVPTDRWDAVRSRLDALLTAEPSVRLHVREPD